MGSSGAVRFSSKAAHFAECAVRTLHCSVHYTQSPLHTVCTVFSKANCTQSAGTQKEQNTSATQARVSGANLTRDWRKRARRASFWAQLCKFYRFPPPIWAKLANWSPHLHAFEHLSFTRVPSGLLVAGRPMNWPDELGKSWAKAGPKVAQKRRKLCEFPARDWPI